MRVFLACLAVLLLALIGYSENVKFMKKGEGMPPGPAGRQAFVTGMFAVPTLLLLAGIACGAKAVRGRQRYGPFLNSVPHDEFLVGHAIACHPDGTQ
jgi:hypothetical protein